MTEYDWPGNVRELENMLTHTAIHTQGEVILEEFIAPLLGEKLTNHRNSMAVSNGEQDLKENRERAHRKDAQPKPLASGENV